MVQHRWRSGNNRPDPGQLVHDYRGGGGAKRRAGPTISTEWATHKFADRHSHQPADPCGTAGFPERPGPKPDRAAATDDDHPPGDVEASDLHPDLYADLHPDLHPDLYAALSGADPRAELGGTDHQLVRAGHSGAHIVGALKGTAAGRCAKGRAIMGATKGAA
jgi:hypothetical protein